MGGNVRGMSVYVIPQCNVNGFISGKSYMAFDADDRLALVENESGEVYAINRQDDERFEVVEMEGGPDDRDIEINALECVILAMVREKYLGTA